MKYDFLDVKLKHVSRFFSISFTSTGARNLVRYIEDRQKEVPLHNETSL